MGRSFPGMWAGVGIEKIFVPSETKKSAGVRDAICKEYASKLGTASDGTVTATELRAAQNQLEKRALVAFFGKGIWCRENGQGAHKRSRIKSLDPRMEGGFVSLSIYLVVGGRLQKAQALPYKTRHPRKIDSHHEHVQLIIEDMHRTYHHPPAAHLLNQIRQEYWIIHSRQAIRSVKFKCNYPRSRRWENYLGVDLNLE